MRDLVGFRVGIADRVDQGVDEGARQPALLDPLGERARVGALGPRPLTL